MCGIAGFVNIKNYQLNLKDIINQMIIQLHRRGPDEKGFYIWNKFVLGISRLKIIDIIKGSQPIFNEDKNIVVVLNGEIYNYKELRNELLQRNHRFYTNTDTEVLVHLYEEYKENMLNKLNGMFSFAILDKLNRKLFIARDRLGIKPLYFYYDKNLFAFASELKAFLPFFNNNLIKKKINYKSLVNYLIMEYVPAPYSIYNNFFKLLPGHYIVFKKDKPVILKYWDISPANFDYSKENRIINQFYDLLEDSVRIRLRADVPLGIFLSGGIDSSTITYFAHKFIKSLSTFSITFDEPSFDETKYINTIVNNFKIKHYSHNFTPEAMRKIIPDVVKYVDEPFADASILPTYMLSKFTRQKVTVALGGDGGDELLAGYPTYQAFYLAKYYNILPAYLKKIVNYLSNKLPVSDKNFSFDFKLKKFLSAADYPYISRNFLWLGSFSLEEIQKLLIPEIFKEIKSYNPFDDLIIPDEIKHLPPLMQILYIDIKYYLQNDILVKVDRASMANSLEVRVPFLDHRIVEYLFSMPLKYKIRFLKTKWILKKMMKNYLPKKNVFRPKKGFGIPIAKWIKNGMKNEISNLFNKENIEKLGIFNYNYIEQLLNEHLEGKINNRKKIWTLISLVYWHKNYGE